MIEKKEKKGEITIYYVKKDYDDNKLSKVLNKKLKRSDIKDFIDDLDKYISNVLVRILYRYA